MGGPVPADSVTFGDLLMFAKLEALEHRFEELEDELSLPDTLLDQDRYRRLAKTHADLKEIVDTFRRYCRLSQDLKANIELLEDANAEIRFIAEEEAAQNKAVLPELEQQLKLLLMPKNSLDEKNTIVEIRAGTGGEEAALFVADLFRMYLRYAENRRWRVELLSENETGTGGFKEVIALFSGDKVYSRLKYEAGIHRVQRVPATESKGRIHTSAVTVAILPEAEDIEMDIKPEELRVDVFRSSGPGGQSVNTTDSAIRIIHLPTGITVSCQDEKSQFKNKLKAMKVLRARLLQIEQDKRQEAEAESRRAQVGTGDRSGRIRTYNYPQNRVTDHRIDLTLYKLDMVLDGALDEFVDGLITHYQAVVFKHQVEII
ncbi:peptide chain release factor RF1 [Desulfovibrionales bacterium]